MVTEVICPYCGADMGAAEFCPYCGSENADAAKRKHNEEILKIYRKIAAIFHMPEKQTEMITKFLIWLSVGLVAAFIVFCAAAFVFSVVNPRLQMNSQNHNLEVLEQHYQDGNLDEMLDYLDRIDDNRKAIYDKYRIVGEMQDALDRATADLDEEIEDAIRHSGNNYLLEYRMESLFDILCQCEQLEAGGYIYEEEKGVNRIRSTVMSVLTSKLLLTEEEIAQGITQALQDDTDCAELCKISVERLKGRVQ